MLRENPSFHTKQTCYERSGFCIFYAPEKVVRPFKHQPETIS